MGYALDELGPERCRDIAEGLFEVEKVYGQKLHGFCPVHGDQKSASFVYHFADDWCKCQSCDFGGDLVNLWCEVNNLDSRGDGFKQFKDEFVDNDSGRPASRKRSTRQPARSKPAAPEVFVDEADIEALPPLQAARAKDLQETRGWSPEVMEIMDLREFDAGRGNKRIAMPIRDDAGRLCNVRLYLPGADKFKVISWYDKKCKACGGAWKMVKKVKTCKECGAHPNDYGRTRLYPSPAHWKPGLIWLLEGEPDLLCALSQGLNAVTQTAGCSTWREEFSEAFVDRDVVIGYDADVAGFKGAMKAAKAIAGHAKSVRVVIWPEVMGK